jgi:hypothetical protein
VYDEALVLLGRVQLERGDADAARAAWLRVRQGSASVQARAFLEALDSRPTAARLEAAPSPGSRDLLDPGGR